MTAVTFSPDGSTLASGSRDNTVRLWDVNTGQLKRVLLGDTSGRWLSCEEKQCLCFDNDTVWSKTKGYCTKRLAPAEIQRTGSLSVQSFDENIVVADGEAKNFNVTIRNISDERVYWTQIVHQADSVLNRLVLHAPPALAVLEPDQQYQFNLAVSVKSDYFDPKIREELLNLHIVSAHAQPISLKIKVTTKLPLLKLKQAMITWDDADILNLSIANLGQQNLPQSTFSPHWQHQQTLEEGWFNSISRPELAQGKTELLSFALDKQQSLDKYKSITLNVRKTGYPSHVWRIPVTQIDSQRIPTYFIGLFILIILLGIVIYYYFLYRHPLVILLSKNANRLLELPINELPDVKKYLSKTKRLNTILAESQVQKENFNQALNFLQQPIQQQAEYLGERLGSQNRPPIQTLADNARLFSLYLNESFALNLESCLLYFPPADISSKEIINQLQQWDSVSLQKVIIISFNPRQQQALRIFSQDPATLMVVPDSSELNQWLLKSNPLEAFAKVLASQLKITQISPYQTRSGVNKDNVFFGRAQILAHMLNREPSNYLVVGGRQLGKSSVLKHLHRRYQDHNNVECHYITLHGGAIEAQLANALGLASDSDLTKVLNHLADPKHKRRFLLLIDEADMFIKNEMERDYRILNQFRSLSEEGHCFFVLAGFWNLYEAAVLEYQSPLKNFGEPITIGALEKEACKDLIIKPMEMLNIQYSDDFNFNTLLTATGRRANLIAITCNEMLNNLGNERRSLENSDLLKALTSDAIVEALTGWESLTNDENASRLDRIIVYATGKQQQFNFADVRKLIEQYPECDYSAEDIKHSLLRLTLSFVIKRAPKGNYRYCVPVFRKFLKDDDLDELLEWELKSY